MQRNWQNADVLAQRVHKYKRDTTKISFRWPSSQVVLSTNLCDQSFLNIFHSAERPTQAWVAKVLPGGLITIAATIAIYSVFIAAPQVQFADVCLQAEKKQGAHCMM